MRALLQVKEQRQNQRKFYFNLWKRKEIKKEQFEKTLQLEILHQQKVAAAADAEASYLENQLQEDLDQTDFVNAPNEEISPFDKTMNYLDGLYSAVPSQQVLSPQATTLVPQARENVETEISPSNTRRHTVVHWQNTPAALDSR